MLARTLMTTPTKHMVWPTKVYGSETVYIQISGLPPNMTPLPPPPHLPNSLNTTWANLLYRWVQSIARSLLCSVHWLVIGLRSFDRPCGRGVVFRKIAALFMSIRLWWVPAVCWAWTTWTAFRFVLCICPLFAKECPAIWHYVYGSHRCHTWQASNINSHLLYTDNLS